MNDIMGFLAVLGDWSLNWFWFPLLIWSVIVLLVRFGRMLISDWTPAAQYNIDSAILFALPVGLLLLAIRSTFGPWSPWMTISAPMGLEEVFSGSLESITVTGERSARLWFSFPVAAGIAFLVVSAIGAARLMRLAMVQAVLRSWVASMALPSRPEVLKRVAALKTRMGIRRHVRTVTVRAEVAPFAYGVAIPTVVLPERLTNEPEACNLAIAHELAHIKRRDLAFHLLEHIVVGLFGIHPLVSELSNRLRDMRELACDAMVLARPEHSRHSYAGLIYRYAVLPFQLAPETVALGTSKTNLKNRISAMRNHNPADKQQPLVSLLAALALFGLLVGLVSCTDIETADAVTAIQAEQVESQSSVTAATPIEALYEQALEEVDEMPNLEGGVQSIFQHITYPDVAKREGIEGTVLVEFVVDEEGEVHGARVKKGVHEALDAEAVAAVEKATFTPGLVDGRPVKTKMMIPIKYKLQ